MVVSVLEPLGGVEAAPPVTLSRELRSLGHDVLVHVLEPASRPKRNLDALERASMGAASARLFRSGTFQPQAVAEKLLAAYRLAVDAQRQRPAARQAA